jgi:hypothetical protein
LPLDRYDVEEIRVACGFLDTHMLSMRGNVADRCIARRLPLASRDSGHNTGRKILRRKKPQRVDQEVESGRFDH